MEKSPDLTFSMADLLKFLEQKGLILYVDEDEETVCVTEEDMTLAIHSLSSGGDN